MGQPKHPSGHRLGFTKVHLCLHLALAVTSGTPGFPPLSPFVVPRTHENPKRPLEDRSCPAALRSGLALCAFTSGSRRESRASVSILRIGAQDMMCAPRYS